MKLSPSHKWLGYSHKRIEEAFSEFRRLHESFQSRVAAGAIQHVHRQRILFKRSTVDELSRPLLSLPLAV